MYGHHKFTVVDQQNKMAWAQSESNERQLVPCPNENVKVKVGWSTKWMYKLVWNRSMSVGVRSGVR